MIARVIVGDGGSVLLGAADTFRAAAADQLATWAERVGATVVRGPEGADPASVAFDALHDGTEKGVGTVVIDTAGRLHTKTGLMDELGKVKRVLERQAPVDEVLLVLDATTGQNGLIQARVFSEVVDVTGIVLTKLDGTAKGGVIFAVAEQMKLPIRFIGVGEGIDDLRPMRFGRNAPIPGFASEDTVRRLKQRFGYVFAGRYGYPTIVDLQSLGTVKIAAGFGIDSCEMPHGPIASTGFRFEADGKSIGYATDFNALSDRMIDMFRGVDVLVTDCLHREVHPTHASLGMALDFAERTGAGIAVLTHLDKSMDYATLSAETPDNVLVGFDGMEIEL